MPDCVPTEDALKLADGRVLARVGLCTVCGACTAGCYAEALEMAGRTMTVDALSIRPQVHGSAVSKYERLYRPYQFAGTWSPSPAHVEETAGRLHAKGGPVAVGG
jgi:ferredoxin